MKRKLEEAPHEECLKNDVTNIEIIVGTYECFTLGYRVVAEDNKFSLVQTFADKTHSGPIKCLAVHGKYLATGSIDDRIFVYDLQKRKQFQILQNHESTVNTLMFTPDGTHIFSGGDDGHIVANSTDHWTRSGVWNRAHNGKPVTYISCHPSSKLALSLGMDLVLCTWNLVGGRVAYRKNLKNMKGIGNAPECLSWSPDGEHFTLSGPRVVQVWSIGKACVVRSEQVTSKPICVDWATPDVVLVGMEDGHVTFVPIEGSRKISSQKVHDSRVKALSVLNNKLVTVSSSGALSLWDVDALKFTLTQIASKNIDCRATCVGIADLSTFLSTKTDDQTTDSISLKEGKPSSVGVKRNKA